MYFHFCSFSFFFLGWGECGPPPTIHKRRGSKECLLSSPPSSPPPPPSSSSSSSVGVRPGTYFPHAPGCKGNASPLPLLVLPPPAGLPSTRARAQDDVNSLADSLKAFWPSVRTHVELHALHERTLCAYACGAARPPRMSVVRVCMWSCTRSTVGGGKAGTPSAHLRCREDGPKDFERRDPNSER